MSSARDLVKDLLIWARISSTKEQLDEKTKTHPLPVKRQAEAGRLPIDTLMAKMGITALYRKPSTSKRHPAHKIYPYPVAQSRHRAGEPCLGDGHHVLHAQPTRSAKTGTESLEHVWNTYLVRVDAAVTSMPYLCYERQSWVSVGMVQKYARLASDHLVQYVDRMSGLRCVRDGEVITFRLEAAK